MFRRIAMIAGGMTCAALGVVAQGPVFKSGTDLVTINVLVTDAKGKAVSDLTAKDFQIVEKGRAQKISAFSFVRIPPAMRTEVLPSKLPPVRDVITNQLPAHSRVFAIVVDDLHLLPQHAMQARTVLGDTLRTIPSTDRVAIVFTGRSDLSVDFTTDYSSLMRALDRVRGSLGFGMDPSPVACGPRELERQHQAIGAVDVLKNVVTALSQTRADERSVIYVSEGLNHDWNAAPANNNTKPPPDGARTCSPEGVPAVPASQSAMPGDPVENVPDAQFVKKQLQDVFDLAVRRDVRMYTIDPRGNMPCEASFIGDVNCGRNPELRSKITLQNDFLRTVAENTGGLAMVQRSDLKGGIREILEDTGSYYLLGYAPDPLVRDGAYHEVKVTTTRPGLKVRSKKGYDAPEANAKAKTPAEALSAGLTSAVAADDLVLSAFVAPIAASIKSTRTVITVEVNYPGPQKLPASIDDDLQFQVIASDAEGKGRVLSQHAFHFAMTPTRMGDVAFLINDAIELPLGVVNLRIGVASTKTGAVGTVAVPMTIPDLSSASLQIPAIVLSVGAKEAAMRGDALTGLIPFQPMLARTFTNADLLRIYAPISGGSKTAATSVTMSITGGAAPLTQTFDVPARTAVDKMVQLARLTPGNYVLTVSARVPGKTAVSRAVGFKVEARR